MQCSIPPFTFVVLAGLISIACSSQNGEDSASDDATTDVILNGAVHKGPFVLGSNVSVNLLDNSGNPTGDVFNTTTSNDKGEFELTLNAVNLGPAEIVTSGFYFNEISGSLSTAQISMRAFTEITTSGTQTAYVNALTHMAQQRAKTLYSSGIPFATAVTQAEQELRAALGVLEPASVGAATDMNLLGGDTDDNAYLMAVSCILGQVAKNEAPNSIDAKLQELINTIAIGLEPSGTLDPSITQRIEDGEAALDGLGCMLNIADRLIELGDSVTVVPDVYKSLDFDGDMTADAADNDADGDGVVKTDDTLVSIAVSDMILAAVDNIDDDGNGGQVWLLSEYDTSAAEPVMWTSSRPLEISVGVPMIGAIEVFGDGHAGIFIQMVDDSLWSYSSGTLTQFTAVPVNIMSLSVSLTRPGWLVVTTSNEAYHVEASSSTQISCVSDAVMVRETENAYVYLDTLNRIWLCGRDFIDAPMEITGLSGAVIIDLETSSQMGYALDGSGAVYEFDPNAGPTATIYPSLTGATELKRGGGGMEEIYAITNAGIWSIGHGSTAVLTGTSDFSTVGGSTYFGGSSALLGIKNTGEAHLVFEDGNSRDLYVPR